MIRKTVHTKNLSDFHQELIGIENRACGQNFWCSLSPSNQLVGTLQHLTMLCNFFLYLRSFSPTEIFDCNQFDIQSIWPESIQPPLSSPRAPLELSLVHDTQNWVYTQLSRIYEYFSGISSSSGHSRTRPEMGTNGGYRVVLHGNVARLVFRGGWSYILLFYFLEKEKGKVLYLQTPISCFMIAGLLCKPENCAVSGLIHPYKVKRGVREGVKNTRRGAGSLKFAAKGRKTLTPPKNS